MSSGINCPEQKEYRSVFCSAGFTHGVPYILDYSSAAHGPVAAAPATLAIAQIVGVPQDATTAVPGWYPFQTRGVAECMVNGTAAIADGDFLELITTGDALVFDHGTVRTAGSVAVATAATSATADALATVYLIGDPVTIAGS